MTNNIEPDHKKNPVSKLLTKLTCGALAGISGTIVVFPLDLVKTRLQNSKYDVAKGKWPYKGMLDCFQQTLKADGPRGLYRGLIPNLVGITPEKAIKLAVNDYARELLARKYNVAPEKLPIGLGVLAGASAGFCQVIATTPMEIIKIHLQIASTTTPAGCKHPTGLDVIRRLGLRGIYRGTGATLMRDVPFSVVFFPLQAYLKSLCADSDGSVAFPYVFFSGVVAGMAGSAIVTPADVIKTRMQAATTHSHSYMEVARDIFYQQGLLGLFRGVVARMIVVSPLFGFSILFYETAERWMAKEEEREEAVYSWEGGTGEEPVYYSDLSGSTSSY